MTPVEVAAELDRRVPGRRNDLPLIKSGSRVAVSYRGVTARGTIRSSYGTAGNAESVVVLDGTDAAVTVSWDLLETIEGGP